MTAGVKSSKKKVLNLTNNLLVETYKNAALIVDCTKDLQVVTINVEAENVFGYSKEEFLSKPLNSLVSSLYQEDTELFNTIHSLKKNEYAVTNCCFQTKQGGSITSKVKLIRFNFDGPDCIHIVLTDIVSKTLKKPVTLKNINSLGDVVNSLPVNILIFTNEQLVYKNEKGQALYRESLNVGESNLYAIFPREHKYMLREMTNELNEGINSYTEITLGSEEKRKRYTVNMVNIVYGEEESILMMLTDITLQNEYSVQKIRAEIAEETNKQLVEEIRLHHKTQSDLIAQTSKLNALFESSSSLFILTINKDLKITSFNTSFKEMMLKYLNVEVDIGNDFLNSFPISENTYGKLIKKFKLALRGESVEIISHFPSEFGEIWIESFISPVCVEGEDIKEIAFVAHNITEKVENEKKVLDSEASNRATVSAIPDMLFKVNKEGYFTSYKFNEEGTDLFKDFAYTTDLFGRHVNEIFKNDRIARSFLYNIKKAINTGEIHTQNFTIPFIIGKTNKKLYYENRYSRINANEVVVIARDVTDKVEFETHLIESVREKEILLKEVHHRVKNNLQVISSILNLQSSYVDDEKTLEIINESQNRIRSMSYIHESLYQTKDFSSINFKGYITNLVQNLIHSYQLFSGKTTLNLQIEEVQLVLDQAIPCGLILNELVSNSLKYAYPDGKKGEILIAIKEEEGNIVMQIEDFGEGLPKGFKIEESDSLGLGLVDTLVDQIDGELILKTDKGTKYLIIFEKQDI